MKNQLIRALAGLACLASATLALAQSTAFTYQGVLTASGGPVTGTYDLVFSLHDSASGGSPVGWPLTNNAVGVTNGVFTTTLDFGDASFTGADRWLEIGVRTNGGGTFSTLDPRQPLTATPYALQSRNASGVPAGAITSTMIANEAVTAGKLAAGAVSQLGAPDGSPPNAVVVDNNGSVGLGSASPLARLHASIGFGGTDDPAAVLQVENCGGPCGQPAWTEAARLWNLNGNGRVGLGLLSGTDGALTNVPDVYLGTDDGAWGVNNNFRIATKVAGVLADRMYIDGTTGNVGIGGSVGIGTSNPQGKMHIFQSGTQDTLTDPAADLIVQDFANAFVQVNAWWQNDAGILFGRPTSARHGAIIYNDTVSGSGLRFLSGAATRMTINDATGHVAIGPGAPSNPNGFSQVLNIQGNTTGPFPGSAAVVFTDPVNNRHWSAGITTSGNLEFFRTGGGNNQVRVAGEVTCTAVNITSDRNAKEQFKPVNAREVLAKVARLPISEWQYKTQADARHIGPMAQDFREAFGMGRDDKHITSVDADGVALAAIQGLNEKLDEKSREVEQLKQTVAELRDMVNRLASAPGR